jgi:hypothetical protein
MGVQTSPLFQLEEAVYFVNETAEVCGLSTKAVHRQLLRGILIKPPTGLRTISVTRDSASLQDVTAGREAEKKSHRSRKDSRA